MRKSIFALAAVAVSGILCARADYPAVYMVSELPDGAANEFRLTTHDGVIYGYVCGEGERLAPGQGVFFSKEDDGTTFGSFGWENPWLLDVSLALSSEPDAELIYLDEEWSGTVLLNLDENVAMFTNEETGWNPAAVENIVPESMDSETAVYDVMGRRVRSTVPGSVYIRGGKKFVAR